MKHDMPVIFCILLGLLLVYSLGTQDARLEKRFIGATAQCKDGSYTTSKRGPGVCSSHGGVKRWIERDIAQ